MRLPASVALRVGGTVEPWFLVGFDLRRVRGAEGLQRACGVGRTFLKAQGVLMDVPVWSLGGRSSIGGGRRGWVDHERLGAAGLDERTESGRRRVVELALEVPSQAGVEVVEAGSLGSGKSTLRVEQRPPVEYRSNAAWAAALMVNVAGAYVRDPQEGANALEVAVSSGGRFSEDALSVPLARAVRYLGGVVEEGASAEDKREAVGLAWKESGRSDLGDPESRFAAVRAMLRAELFEAGSPVIEGGSEKGRETVDPEPYGDTFGGCLGWHLSEASPEFRKLDPGGLGRACEAVAVVQAANELLEHSGLMATQDAPVGFGCADPDIRVALERYGVAEGPLSMLGSVVKGQVVREFGHPLDPVREQVEAVPVEPAAFRPLDSRWPEDEGPIVDRVLSVCARSGVAVRLTAGDRVGVRESVSEQQRDDPFPATVSYGLYAVVDHPVPEKFRSTEEWARSLLEGVAFAVVTHPRLANHAQLESLGEKSELQLFDQAVDRVCYGCGIDRKELVEEAVSVSVGEVGPDGGRRLRSVAEMREDGVAVPEKEVLRRAMWLGLEGAVSQGGVGGDGPDAVGFRRAMVQCDADFRTASRLVKCSSPEKLDRMLEPSERWRLVSSGSVGEGVWDRDWPPSERSERRGGGPDAPGRATTGLANRAIAVLAADRILERLGVAGERVEVDAERPGSRTRAFLAGVPKVRYGNAVERVSTCASEVVDFALDRRKWQPRAERFGRRGDVLHSLGANPWADLEKIRAWSRDVDAPVALGLERNADRALVR